MDDQRSHITGFDAAQPLSWTAPEGLQEERGFIWYSWFIVITVALVAIAIFVFKSTTFAVLIPVMALSIILLISKPPRMIHYSINHEGILVGDQFHLFSEFRGFGVIAEHRQPSVLLLPVKRFAPGLTLYFSETDGEKIVDMLGNRLPMQQIKPDAIEKLLRMIKL